MNCILVVHQDGEPFVRTQCFTQMKALKQMVARTHNSILDDGYVLVATRERDQQKVTTYKDTRPQRRTTIYVSVQHA